MNEVAVEDDEDCQEIRETTTNYQIPDLTPNEFNHEVNSKVIDLEAIESYSTHLTEERNQFIKERKNTEKLSNSIENHVIEDAKV